MVQPENTTKAPELTVTDLNDRDLIVVYGSLLEIAIKEVQECKIAVNEAEFKTAVKLAWLDQLRARGITEPGKSEVD